MRIAVASGKGGTGKTTVAVAMALAHEGQVHYMDCDVEEPNGGLFLRPQISNTTRVFLDVPEIDEDRCTSCGKCAAFCRFNALVALGAPPIVFSELCHGCGGCFLVCPSQAVTWKRNPIGTVSRGTAASGRISFSEGRLNLGSVMAPAVIRAVKGHDTFDGMTVIDCPPGTSCPVIEALRGADHALLVTEPTPFGLHDLKLAVETCLQLGISFSVVINRHDSGNLAVENYCEERGIDVALRIPGSRRVAEVYSRGGSLLEAMPEMTGDFKDIPRVIEKRLTCGNW